MAGRVAGANGTAEPGLHDQAVSAAHTVNEALVRTGNSGCGGGPNRRPRKIEQATPDQSFACQVVGLGAPEAPLEDGGETVFILVRGHCTRVVVGGCRERMSFVPRLAPIGLRQPYRRTVVSQVPVVWARLGVRCTAVAVSQRARGCRAQGNTTSERRSVADEGDAAVLYERAGGACLALIWACTHVIR